MFRQLLNLIPRRRNVFRDRQHVGQLLAQRLKEHAGDDVVVLGVARGGVPIAAEVARALNAPLDVALASKLGAPGRPELAIGAVYNPHDPAVLIDEQFVRELDVDEAYVEQETRRQLEEIRRREDVYRNGRPPIDVQGRTVIVCDDGVATGSTTRAVVRGVRQRTPKRVILALGVGPHHTIRELATDADEVVCLEVPDRFMAVGQFFEDFGQTSDEEVIELLREADERGR